MKITKEDKIKIIVDKIGKKIGYTNAGGLYFEQTVVDPELLAVFLLEELLGFS